MFKFILFSSLTISSVAIAEYRTLEVYKIGYIFRDCPVCPEMTVLPAGSFLMGSRNGKKRELPVKKITIEKPFAISRYEATFDEWDACYSSGGCSKQLYDRGWGRGKRPVINVLHTDIREYVSWLSEQSGHLYRLPSESEWEYAARSGSKTEFHWGNKMVTGAANCRACGTQWSGIKTAPVGQFKPNAWGIYDMHGNVLEHVSDCWANSHEQIPRNGSPLIIKNCTSKVIKGGAWYYLPKFSRSSARARNDVRIFSYFIGFRVVRNIR